MGKRVTHSRRRTMHARFGMNKERVYVACDDGTCYVFERATDDRRFHARMRVDADGTRALAPSRLPAAVEAHMDGRTRSGPHGADGPNYWV